MSIIFDSNLRIRQRLASSMLESAVFQGKLSNAYLFTGRNIEDKLVLSNTIARYLNCLKQKSQGSFCLAEDLCQNCGWIKNEKHPQAWIKLSGEGATNKISVEKARLLSEELNKTSKYSRVIVIDDASYSVLHRPAANALLKTLEEPPANCLFFLFASSADEVLPTILSRCQIIPVVKSAQAGLWLDKAIDINELNIEMKVDLSKVRLSEALEWVDYLIAKGQALMEEIEGVDEKLIVDLIVSQELSMHRDLAVNDSRCLHYLKQLLTLGEECKEQMDHFVQPKFAIESFVISWWQIAHAYALA